MGRYGDAVKRANNSIFVQLEPGIEKRLRILDDPYAENKTFMQPNGTPGDPRTVFSWPVWDYDEGKIKILSKGASVLKAVDEITDAWKIQEMPMGCDIVIKATGSGLQTRYSVQGAPVSSELPGNWMKQMPDMDKHVPNGIPVNEYASGAKLQTRVTGPGIESMDDAPNFDEPPLDIPDELPPE